MSMFTTILLTSVLTVATSISNDWLIDDVEDSVQIQHGQTTVVGSNEKEMNASTITLTNALISRTFLLEPDLATLGFESIFKGQSIVRALTREGSVGLDGIEYNVGGIIQGGSYAYFNRSKVTVNVNASAFHYKSYSTAMPQAPFPWTPGTRHSPSDVSWPPKGLQLIFSFVPPPSAPPQHQSIQINVHYEMYVGIPLVAKWISVNCTGSGKVNVTSVIVENLATNPPYSPFSFSPMAHPWERGPGLAGSWLYVETNQAHGTQVMWIDDSHVGDSPGSSEPLLQATYTLGPQAAVSGQNFFDSFWVLELVTDSVDPERVSLSRHRMTRLLAPQTQENPIFMHGTKSDPGGFRSAVDQMVAVGFEMFIYSFGSGFRLETTDTQYLAQIKSDIDYAKSKGIEVGGYDLICLDRGHGGYGGNVGDQWDAIDPQSGKPTANACFSSGWLDKLNEMVFNFINNTGLISLETDGPYGGSSCASTAHDHHVELRDSVYQQTKAQGEFYSKLREMNVYIHQPDNFFYQGGSKTGMGYNENQYSLPRWQDLSVSRQSMYDDTYHFIPTQGWMFVPLVQYHGGGAAATFEPLSQNLVEYEWALAQYFGYGVMPCWRGYRLYDTNETMNVVKKWVNFYKTYRDILTSDIVHIRRPDMQSIDAIIHVNPKLKNYQGLSMIFNPTLTPVKENLTVPIYFTGIHGSSIKVSEMAGSSTVYSTNRDYSVTVPINLQPQSVTWFLFADA
eukprot:m.16731 g.16731  ORF g.16731 m.16731 type:complete len:733 (+) comp27105_c0_seq1:15-2213(+)